MSQRTGIILSLVTLVLAAGAFAGGLSDEYVYDDVRFVERNPAVTTGAPLARYFTDPATQTGDDSWEGLWRPLRTLSFRAVAAAGGGALAQRVANLALHVLNGALVYALLRLLLPGAGLVGALLGALAFVVHPASAEPVSWISGRGDLIATAGILGASVLWLRGRTTAAVVVFAAGLAGKESAIVLPALLLLLVALREGRAGLRRAWPRWLPFLLVAVVWIGARAAVLGGAFAQGAGAGYSPDVLAASSFTEILYYLRALVFPVGLGFDYRLPPASSAPLATALGFLAVCGLVWVAWRSRRRAPAVALAVGWFLVCLVPVTFLQTVFPLKILVANRFLYPALASGALLIAWAAERFLRPAAVLAIAVLTLVPLTAMRAGTFADARSLWDDVLSRDPGNATALYGAGREAARAGEWRRAAACLERAAAIDLSHPAIAALHGDVLMQIAKEEPQGSAEQRRLFVAAQESYHFAVRTWQGGVREERRLYRGTLAEAAFTSYLIGRLDLATEDALALLDDSGPLPPPGPGRERLIQRLRFLAPKFERGGLSDIARGLRELERALSPEEEQ